MAGKAKKKKGPNEELLAVAREARAAGMTYGQYQAEKYLKEQAEQMKKEREAREKALLKKQAEYIKTACQEAGIGGHTILFSGSIKPTTPAQKIVAEIVGKDEFLAKISFMYCDELDMCFFYDQTGAARMSYSGATKAGSDDIRHNLVMAFKTAEIILDKMQELSTGKK